MDPVSTNVSFPELEEKILNYWREHDVFQRSMSESATTALNGQVPSADYRRPSYVFYDGPPFATGLPHYGHLLAGTIKDVVGRFFTMKGYHVDRRFGWDCHGVPVEFEIQKNLELHGAKAIREFGVGKFNEECRKIVLRYTKEWEKFVERSGRWVDFERQYRTMDLEYMESIWWVVKSLWDRGLVYEGFKCVAYSPAINTALSNFEANLNYKDVQSPAITVRVPLFPEAREALGFEDLPDLPLHAYIWTTTPWTLPSNMALAVNPNFEYSAVVVPGKEIAFVASGRLGEFFPQFKESKAKGKKQAPEGTPAEEQPYLARAIPGEKFLGLQYQQFFPYFERERAHNAFRIYPGDFVTADEGTGIVHLASFGEEDLGVFLANDIPVIDPVDEDGHFEPVVTDFAGLAVQDADPKVIANLKQRALLVSHSTIEHSYPFCYRTETPLIYKSISSWFVRVEQIRDVLQYGNSQIHWVPEHIKEGRFGKWLENARDWAISRNRFWGTPLPIWRCDACGHLKCLGSVAELEELAGVKITDLHSHFIDPLTFPCSVCKGEMRRVPQTLDCWFESGSMPYAQAHYPFENKESFEHEFPADFIAEGLDQTRGWFYTLLVLSTALFGRPSFRNVVVNGIVLAEDGRKMSKSLRNYPPPDEVMNAHGADALRLYLLASPATRAEELRFSETGVKQVVRQTLLPLWNAYNFFVTYALVDKWTPAQMPQEASSNLLDRWILSKVASLIEGVDSALSTYHLYSAAQPILEYVDQLTNWYIRLNRRRFWAGNRPGEVEDKLHAYATLHRALLSFVRVLAPLAPFVSESIFLNLRQGMDEIALDSVHLCPFPKLTELKGLVIDKALEKAMELFEQIILLGRALRNEHNLKIRQPLNKITIVYPDAGELENVKLLDAYIREELNVKNVEYTADEEAYVTLTAKLNTKKLGKELGPKLGRERMQKLQHAVMSLSTERLRAIERGDKFEFEELSFGEEDILVERKVKPGIETTSSSGQITISLDTALTQDLRLEGLAREFVNRVQKLRKDFNYEVTDRIIVSYMTACPRIGTALGEYRDYVMRETLAVDMHEVKTEKEIGLHGSSLHLPAAQEIEGKTVIIALSRTQG